MQPGGGGPTGAASAGVPVTGSTHEPVDELVDEPVDEPGNGSATDVTDLAPLTWYTWLSLYAVCLISVAFPFGEIAAVELGAAWIVVALVTVLASGALQVRLLRRAPALRVDARATRAAPFWTVAVLVVLAGAFALWVRAGTGHAVGWVFAMPFGALLAAALVHRARSLLEAGAWNRPATVVVAASLGGGLVVALVGSTSDVPDADVTMRAVYGALVVMAAGMLQLGQVWLWQVTHALHTARTRAAELALANERMRFAAELHDIQGHHLQAIVVTAELAENLVRPDPEAAAAHLRRIRSLALTALEDARAVAYAYRRTTFAAELRNAVALLDAAGVEVVVHGDADLVPAQHGSAMGHLVREATTNHLRHSTATQCTIEIGRVGPQVLVTVRDPGPARTGSALTGTPSGQGLAGLADRFAVVGGTIDAHAVGSAFVLVGRLPLDEPEEP